MEVHQCSPLEGEEGEVRGLRQDLFTPLCVTTTPQPHRQPCFPATKVSLVSVEEKP